MHLVTILTLVACAASSSALFGPLPNLGDIILAKAGLGLLKTKHFLLGRHFGHYRATSNTVSTTQAALIVPNPPVDLFVDTNECVVELETKLEDICKNVPKVTCEIKPVEECLETLISVCNDVIEEVCEEKEENVCNNVSKEVCTKGRCKTVLVPKCSIETSTCCHNKTTKVCHEEPIEKCNSVDKEVCCDSTTLECEKIEKRVPTGRQCCTVITPTISEKCELIQRPVDEEVCKTELKCETIKELKCSTHTDEAGVETEKCCEEPKEVCKNCEVCKMVTKLIEEQLCQDITTHESSIVCK